MEQKITQWLESHRHSEFFKAEMLRNTTYTDIEEYVENTNRSRIIYDATTGDDESGAQPKEMTELFEEFKDFLKSFAIDDLKAYKARKHHNYEPMRITKQGIDDILDYCVLYGLTQQETSRMLDSAIYLVQNNGSLIQPSKAAFAITVLWVQAWYDRVVTPTLRDRLAIYIALNHEGRPMPFKEVDVKFRECVTLAKERYNGNKQ